jgi:hypothetical protein
MSSDFVRSIGPAHQPNSSWMESRLRAPVLASLLQNRWIALLLVGMATLQVSLAALELPGWPCPVKTMLGIPCPGCGLTAAMVLLLHGEWRAALSIHAFAPVFLLGIGIMATVSALPDPLRRVAIRKIAVLEQRTGITTFLLLGLVVYGGLRLVGWL